MKRQPMTNCKKCGIKIKETNNGYKEDPFATQTL
jgi:hypothetical protein